MGNNTKENPSALRESALKDLLKRMGASETPDERYNNGYAHHSLAVHSSFARAFEERMATFAEKITMTITQAEKIDKDDKKAGDPEKLVNRSFTINRPIFENTMTMTRWIENFYQESPSINKIAREDQVAIGTKAFGVPVMIPAGSAMQEDDRDD